MVPRSTDGISASTLYSAPRRATLFVRGIFLMPSFGRKSQQVPAGEEKRRVSTPVPLPCPRVWGWLGCLRIPDIAIVAGQKNLQHGSPQMEPNRCARIIAFYNGLFLRLNKSIGGLTLNEAVRCAERTDAVADEPWQIGCGGGGSSGAVVLREKAPQ